jgi:hypothetical protein
MLHHKYCHFPAIVLSRHLARRTGLHLRISNQGWLHGHLFSPGPFIEERDAVLKRNVGKAIAIFIHRVLIVVIVYTKQTLGFSQL